MTKTYNTKGNMGMIDVTDDFKEAVRRACREKKISSGIITGFTTGGVAALTTLEFEPGLVRHDVREAMQGIAPYRDELSPFITIPFVEGEITIGPWQNLTLVECDTRNRVRDIVFQVMGE